MRTPKARYRFVVAVFGAATIIVGTIVFRTARSMNMELPVVEGIGGYECGAEKCKDEPTLAKCTACCVSRCVDVEGCTDFCLDWFGAKVAIKELSDASTGLKDNTLADANARAEAVTFIENMQMARMPVVKRLARALAKDTPGVKLIGS